MSATISPTLYLVGLSKCMFISGRNVDSLDVIFIKQPADLVRDGMLVGQHGHTRPVLHNHLIKSGFDTSCLLDYA